MAGTAAAATAGQKRKRPPTFQHLPLNRAKKLKQSWVEVQKMKSKWKAQKRKEGLLTGKPLLSNDETNNEENNEDASERAEDSSMQEEISHQGESEHDLESESDNEDENDDSGEDTNGQKPTVSSRGRATPRGSRASRGGPSRQVRTIDDQSKKQSLRELQNQAYSRSSLHTFKSGSHHKQGGPDPRSARGRGNEGPRGSRLGRGRGRGQPDMRLRMNAMLEKIKRDYA